MPKEGYDLARMAAQTTDVLEVEWQFSALDVRPVLRWLQSAAVPGFTVTPAKTTQLDDTYYDTDDWRVHRARYTCRIRSKSDGPELTLKSMAEAVDSMRSRRELTELLPDTATVNPVDALGQCGQLLRAAAGKRALRPIFNLRTDRRTFDLADETGIIGEIAVDETSIPVGEDVPIRLSRVEVEVDAAAVARARRFVDVLVSAAGLAPAGTSKFEAALIATGQHIPSPTPDLGPTTVAASLSAGDVAYAIMRQQLIAFLANEPATRLGEDTEALHDMRVAARRMRAAMSAFAPFISPRLQPFGDQIGWVAAALGDVRDLDVQLERMAEWREGLSEDQSHALDAVEALLVTKRQVACKHLLAVLDSRRYESFVARFSAALRRGPAHNFAAGHVSILAVAPDLLERRYRKLRKAGDGVTRQSAPEAYHALRIDAKKLRYALEFVGPIYGKHATEFSTRVTVLQDLLGLHQDADVAQDALQEMAEKYGRRLNAQALLLMGAISERYRRHAEKLRAGFLKAYKPLAGNEWRRLQKLIESRRPAD